MAQIHCARGSKRCEKCSEMAKIKKFSLIDYFPEPGGITRPMDYFEVDGKKMFLEFDVLMVFESKKEAIEYAEKNSVPIEY